MATLSMFAGFLLAIVFAVSSAGKLKDRAGSRQAMRDFGVPGGLATVAAILLPVVELGVAGLLVLPRTALWGAIGALVLLGVFIVAIGVNMAQGRHPDCQCFGQIHSEPAGWPTIVRNLLLMIPALLIVAGDVGQRALGSAVDDVLASFRGVTPATQAVGGWLSVALVAVFVLAIYGALEDRRLETRLLAVAALLDRGDTPGASTTGGDGDVLPRELPVGTPAPRFEVSDLDGRLVTLDDLLAVGKSTLLVFVDPTCGPCGQLLRELPAWHEAHTARLEIVVISRGDAATNRARPGMAAMNRVLLQRERELAWAYGILGTPSAMLVNPDGTIGSPVAGGVHAVRTLLASLGVPGSAR